jgi:hypothetical protein
MSLPRTTKEPVPSTEAPALLIPLNYRFNAVDFSMYRRHSSRQCFHAEFLFAVDRSWADEVEGSAPCQLLLWVW